MARAIFHLAIFFSKSSKIPLKKIADTHYRGQTANRKTNTIKTQEKGGLVSTKLSIYIQEASAKLPTKLP
jgi:hypothetical protein